MRDGGGQLLDPQPWRSMPAGNLWIANSRISSLTELSNLGAALSPFATGIAAGDGGGIQGGGLNSPGQIAVDPYGNVWLLNADGSLSEMGSGGAWITASGSTIGGGGNPADTANGLAIDGSGNVWVVSAGMPGDVAEYAGYAGGMVKGLPVASGTALSPAGVGYVNGLMNPNGAIAIDGFDGVWLLNQGNYSAAALSGADGHLLDLDQGDMIDPTSNLPFNPPEYLLSADSFGASLVSDNAGDLFIPSDTVGGTAAVYKLNAGSSGASSLTLNQGGTGVAKSPDCAHLCPGCDRWRGTVMGGSATERQCQSRGTGSAHGIELFGRRCGEFKRSSTGICGFELKQPYQP